MMTPWYPIIGSRWHIATTSGPLPTGTAVTLLCGLKWTVEYGHRPLRTFQCWKCDYIYRRANGIPILGDHPGAPKKDEHHAF